MHFVHEVRNDAEVRYAARTHFLCWALPNNLLIILTNVLPRDIYTGLPNNYNRELSQAE